jgi:N-acetylglutamate synthase-like GNAT family acetyltransferase
VTALLLEPMTGSEPDFRAALAAEGLPADDLGEEGRAFFRIVDGPETAGFGGYELHGTFALLRSLVIHPARRRHGVGQAAAALLLDKARAAGARQAYLLTTTAAPFFERLGFARIDRSSAPEAILRTRQAAGLCPSSAALLVRELGG